MSVVDRAFLFSNSLKPGLTVDFDGFVNPSILGYDVTKFVQHKAVQSIL